MLIVPTNVIVSDEVYNHPVVTAIREGHILRKIGGEWFLPVKVQELLKDQDVGFEVRGLACQLTAKYGQLEVLRTVMGDCKNGRKINVEHLTEASVIAEQNGHSKITVLIREVLRISCTKETV